MSAGKTRLRSRLENERKRLLDEIEQISADMRPAEERREGSPFGKREEAATETLELEKRIALERRIKEQLAEMENALAKFDKGTYGLCEVCHQPISLERLDALPEARLCLSCKTKQAKYAKAR